MNPEIIRDDSVLIMLDNMRKKQLIDNEKLKGILFENVMCSATESDQNGLSAVLLKYTIAKMENRRMNDINFKFSNGNLLTLTHDNIEAFDHVWTPFRQSFF